MKIQLRIKNEDGEKGKNLIKNIFRYQGSKLIQHEKIVDEVRTKVFGSTNREVFNMEQKSELKFEEPRHAKKLRKFHDDQVSAKPRRGFQTLVLNQHC